MFLYYVSALDGAHNWSSLVLIFDAARLVYFLFLFYYLVIDELGEILIIGLLVRCTTQRS